MSLCPLKPLIIMAILYRGVYCTHYPPSAPSHFSFSSFLSSSSSKNLFIFIFHFIIKPLRHTTYLSFPLWELPTLPLLLLPLPLRHNSHQVPFYSFNCNGILHCMQELSTPFHSKKTSSYSLYTRIQT